ncbi:MULTISPECIES: GNAT family N-acetyltransferase [Streptomyces]|uniref:GNAT family N-acetyltransferase n=1 Tax=Streptomyces griseoaurantiacus TaxID=68213 RepID=A0A7W2DYV9_9ACTN|nr:GNAT family N-acetyltransferase [Streptomyces griseoaurantiacus]MBA5225396.1 GNAT family N-acetyltransferase [Streptomyces griseoaurantiacus]
MSLAFTLDPAVTPALRNGLLTLWTDVSNAGGSVGFVPPVEAGDVRPALVRHFVAMSEGHTRLLVGRYDADDADDTDGADGADKEGEVVAAAFLAANTHPLMRHWAWLHTVMVHPRRQGGGHGRALLAAAERAARAMPGIEAIRLTCRGGTGLERFYEACGYKEVGRVPGAIRVGPGDDRDDVTMLLALV